VNIYSGSRNAQTPIYTSPFTSNSINGTFVNASFVLAADTAVYIEYAENGFLGMGAIQLDINRTLPTGAVVPFAKQNTAVGTFGGALDTTNLNTWKLDTFAATGNLTQATALTATNSMNLGLAWPIDVAARGNSVFILDYYGYTWEVDRAGIVQAVYPKVSNSKAIAVTSTGVYVLSSPCTITEFVSPSSAPNVISVGCGNGTSSSVFRSEIRDITSDGTWLYALDTERIWSYSTSIFVTQPWIPYQATFVNPTQIAFASASSAVVVSNFGLTAMTLSTLYSTGPVYLVTGSATFPLGTSFSPNDVGGITFLNASSVLMTSTSLHAVTKVDVTSGTQTLVAGISGQPEPPYVDANNIPVPVATAKMFQPTGIVVGAKGVYITQNGYGLVKRLHQ
jgi:hypothetical protein